uniref:Uncharacterized protein n=1 Tax=Anguilla anguilla TaxID=7936 RepID=A0A0E9UF09_ANGAN
MRRRLSTQASQPQGFKVTVSLVPGCTTVALVWVILLIAF